MLRWLALLPIAVLACKKDPPAQPPPREEPQAQVQDKGQQAQDKDPARSEAACAKAKPEGVLAWIEDDYPAALACAKARKLPLVLDLWAPWCHTCLSMMSTVFTDRSFADWQGGGG